MDELWKELQSVREDLRMVSWLADGFDRAKKLEKMEAFGRVGSGWNLVKQTYIEKR